MAEAKKKVDAIFRRKSSAVVAKLGFKGEMLKFFKEEEKDMSMESLYGVPNFLVHVLHITPYSVKICLEFTGRIFYIVLYFLYQPPHDFVTIAFGIQLCFGHFQLFLKILL